MNALLREHEQILLALNFVLVPASEIRIGTRYPIVCQLEGCRRNEVGVRDFDVKPFWLNKFCVTNADFEKFNPYHNRPPTSERDKDPVTDVTYLDALRYARWLSRQYELPYVTLPTEPEWVCAAAPFGWEFPYKKGPKPQRERAHTYDPSHYHTLEVDDDRFETNFLGLYHVGGNVMEMTLGWYYTSGQYGSETDGAYYIAKGGDFGHCSFSAGIQRRAIVDVSMRSSRIGFRLAYSCHGKTSECEV
jgi:formylglycine-generating enzyme required for sulfatase activity